MIYLLSDNIRKYRKKNNMSQDELAEKLAVTRQSVSLWETGQTQPSLDNIVALSKLFNISTDDLLTDETRVSVGVDSENLLTENTVKKKNNIFVPFICSIATAFLIFALLFNLGVFDSKKKKENFSEVSNDTINMQGNSVNVIDKDIYGYLKNFTIQNGYINGDYCYYSKTADNYGGSSSEKFSLYYWGDSGKVEFCLHRVIDDTYSINFYLYVPEEHTGEYEYISSYYYRDSGISLYEASGTISSGEFTKNYPLNCTEYFGSTSKQDDFMETSRLGICELIDCLKKFIVIEKLDYSFSDFGFSKF